MTAEKNDNDWPARLKALRKRLGLTQSEAASKALIRRETWNRFEAGKQKPSERIKRLIELALSVGS